MDLTDVLSVLEKDLFWLALRRTMLGNRINVYFFLYMYNDLKKTETETQCKKGASSSSHWQSPPLVVILKDMESFATKVLQDFIVIGR